MSPATRKTRMRSSSGCTGSRVRCAGSSGWSRTTATASTSSRRSRPVGNDVVGDQGRTQRDPGRNCHDPCGGARRASYGADRGILTRRLGSCGVNRKLVVFVPPEALDPVREALFAAGAGRIGDYERCSWYTQGTGTFLGGEAASPTIGERGRE